MIPGGRCDARWQESGLGASSGPILTLDDIRQMGSNEEDTVWGTVTSPSTTAPAAIVETEPLIASVDERDGFYLLYATLIARKSGGRGGKDVEAGTSTSRRRGEEEAMKGSQGDVLVVHLQR